MISFMNIHLYSFMNKKLFILKFYVTYSFYNLLSTTTLNRNTVDALSGDEFVLLLAI